MISYLPPRGARRPILLVTNVFPPNIGGPATFIDHLARHLAGRGHRVRVVCSSLEPEEATDRERPFRVRRVPLRNRVRFEAELRLVLARELAGNPRTLVNGLELATYQVARALRRPYLLKIVGDSVWENLRTQGETALSFDEFQGAGVQREKWAFLYRRRDRPIQGASLVITPSEFMRRTVISWGMPASQVRTVLNGVGSQSLVAGPLPRRGDEQLRLLFIGRLTNWKGVETLLLACKGLPGVEITLLGGGPERAMLSGLARQLGLKGVVFRGVVPHAESQRELRRSHVLVLTSLYEGLSHTLLEAMAAGVPVVASDCGGNAELVRDGENGLLVPPQEVSRLRSAIETLSADESIRLRLSAGGLTTARDLSFDRAAGEYERLLLVNHDAEAKG